MDNGRWADLFCDRIYGIVSMEHGNGRSVEEQAIGMLEGGIRIIQYREKRRAKNVRLEECRRLRLLTREWNAMFVVNDDFDVALACDADGVHVGQTDMPVSEVRRLAGRDFIIGLSTHSVSQLEAAQESGADYIGVGPVYATRTKDNPDPVVGLELVSYAASRSRLPFVAIGGIKPHSIDAVIAAGARCVCCVTAITAADDIPATVRVLQSRFFTINK
jgi:thiamine-phosphate pyrophosphorylase